MTDPVFGIQNARRRTTAAITACALAWLLLQSRASFKPAAAAACPVRYKSNSIACAEWTAGQTALAVSKTKTGTLAAAGLPQPAPAKTKNPWGKLALQAALSQNTQNPCTFTATVSWQTGHASAVSLTVYDSGSDEEQPLANAPQGRQVFPDIPAGKSFRLRLWDKDTGAQLDQLWVSAHGLACLPHTQQNTPADSGENFSLSSDSRFCVGQAPSYAVRGNIKNAPLSWKSEGPDGGSEHSAVTDKQGNFTAAGEPWTEEDVGHWTKTATINGTSKSIEFTVRDCPDMP